MGPGSGGRGLGGLGGPGGGGLRPPGGVGGRPGDGGGGDPHRRPPRPALDDRRHPRRQPALSLGSGQHRPHGAPRAGRQGPVADAGNGDRRHQRQPASAKRRAGGLTATAGSVAWDTALRAMPNPHLLQTHRWGELQSRFGWAVERHHVEAGELTVPVSVLVTPTLVPGGRSGYVAKGPALDADRIAAALEPLSDLARGLELAVLTIEPELAPGWAPPAPWRRGTPMQPRHTSIIDLRPAPAHILASLQPNTRYNLRLAQKKGVVVEQSDDVGAFAARAEQPSPRHRIQLTKEPYSLA